MIDIPEGVERLWLIGKPGVGKTHIADWLAKHAHCDAFHLGRVLRKKYGEEYFLKADNSLAPDATEKQACRLVEEYFLKADDSLVSDATLIIDSMPKRVDQVDIIPGDADLVVMIRCDEEIRQARLKNRAQVSRMLAVKASKDFDKIIGSVMTALDARGIPIITVDNNQDKPL